jgi:transcriptional regulator with XRE-family HTH domain
MQIKQASAIEQYAIDRVRELRKAKGISQAELANRMDVSISFIGRVESKNFIHKYNLNHLNSIAEILGCKIWDLLPEKPIKHKHKR